MGRISKKIKQLTVGDIFIPGGNYDYKDGISADVIDFAEFLLQFIEIAICRFEYENMPDEINQYDFERFLIESGNVIFFQDDVTKKFVALPASGNSGVRDKYNHPVKVNVKSLGTKPINYQGLTDFVEVRNTPLAASDIPRIVEFAKHLYEYDRTIDINVIAQKTPILLTCDQNQRLSVKNAYMQYVGNMPVIHANKTFDRDAIQVMRTDAPFNAPGIYDLKVKVFNEYLTYLGISNVNYQKRERMVTDEVNRGLGGVLANRHRYLKMRQDAIEKINKRFGLNIKVAFNDVDVSDIIINERDESALSDNESEVNIDE